MIRRLGKLESVPVNTREAIDAVFGCISESFLPTSDNQHETEYVIHWLEPGYPRNKLQLQLQLLLLQQQDASELVAQAQAHVKQLEGPSSRTKVAIRQSLKEDDEHTQRAFVAAYNCKMMVEFGRWFPETFSTLEQVLALVEAIHEYYQSRLGYLNLTLGAKQMFNANLTALLELHLIRKSNFLTLTRLKLSAEGNISGKDETIVVSIGLLLQKYQLATDLYEVILDLQIGRIRHLVQRTSHDWDKSCLKRIHASIRSEILQSNWNKLNAQLVDLDMLLKFTNTEVITLKIANCFQIIGRYPQSRESLEELYNCLAVLENHYYQRDKLVHTFIDSCQNNLLHSGVNTVDIIKFYTKTIWLFLIIDPRGVLLDRVVRPIRRYLKSRDDTIYILVKGILDTSPQNKLVELAEDLRLTPTNKGSHKSSRLYYDDANDLTLKWVPDPLDALPDFKRDRITDIIESLISIFDSKDLFIAQITKYFVEPLIGKERWNVDEIAKDVKFLKLKFGDDKFTNLDIMIDDIKQSLTTGKSQADQANPFIDSVVLSHLYWPNLDETSPWKLPYTLQRSYDEYSSLYKAEKPGRYLRLIPTLGSVTIELTEFRTKAPKNYTVSPLQAMVIYQFNDVDGELSVSLLVESLGATEFEIRHALEYWCKEGILEGITSQLYMVAEEDDDIFR